MVEQFIDDGVIFVGVVGVHCSRIEDIIDEAVVGKGLDDNRSILMAFHAGETLEDAVEFANSLTLEFAGHVQIVEL